MQLHKEMFAHRPTTSAKRCRAKTGKSTNVQIGRLTCLLCCAACGCRLVRSRWPQHRGVLPVLQNRPSTTDHPTRSPRTLLHALTRRIREGSSSCKTLLAPQPCACNRNSRLDAGNRYAALTTSTLSTQVDDVARPWLSRTLGMKGHRNLR